MLTKYKTYVQHEQIHMIRELGNIYLGHATPMAGKSSDIANAMIEYILKE